MPKIKFVLILIIFAIQGYAQETLTQKINWVTLRDVKFTKKFNKEYELDFLYPSFGASLLKLEGKYVEIKGYVIPVSQNLYVLSAKPMAACFFCGGSGPESIIQLNFATKNRFKTDQIITVKGKFRLNSDNVDDLNYILDDASLIQFN
ncbi:DUF3299 domain-containing protein [Lacihabitans sp. CS3-21]|uniref:DUF3299 domain-containing protein n=1 Tax=Lacihabitans sp. CS3-21 TaxID=2487332 RepID=UPI0020CDC4F0|nr:DUF3299 domain-containing protein [Lacihabitans sp. CS3-21]